MIWLKVSHLFAKLSAGAAFSAEGWGRSSKLTHMLVGRPQFLAMWSSLKNYSMTWLLACPRASDLREMKEYTPDESYCLFRTNFVNGIIFHVIYFIGSLYLSQ